MVQILVGTIYSKEVEYVCDYLFGMRLKMPYQIAWSGEEDNYQFVFNGKTHKFPNSFLHSKVDVYDQVSVPNSLAGYMNGVVTDRKVSPSPTDKIPVLFGKSSEGNATFAVNDVDILGSIFFMLSRVEEYESQHVDKLGRYKTEAALAYKADFLNFPIVDYLVRLVGILLEAQDDNSKYKVEVGFDVDHPYIGLYSWKRNLKELAKDFVLRKDWGLAFKRIGFLLSGRKKKFDPHFNFDFLLHICKQFGLAATFFFIGRNGKGGIDGAYSVDSRSIRSLIKTILDNNMKIGFHPSTKSFLDVEQLTREYVKVKETVEDIAGDEMPMPVRAHYLRVQVSKSLEQYKSLGCIYDSSLLLSNSMGFRCGTCHPFKVFSLDNKIGTSLIERPLLYMDTAALHITGDVLEQYSSLVKTVRFYRGSLGLLFHNNLLISRREIDLFVQILERACKEE